VNVFLWEGLWPRPVDAALQNGKPAGYDSPIGHRTPHIHFDIKGRHQRLITQMYFSEDHATNSADQLYNQLGEDAVTAMAALQVADRYRWDIVLGEG
jgi:protocatechuate 3,4-dioxygenase beta subunit